MAYNFVTNGINTGFWEKNDKWKCSSEFSRNSTLTAVSIIAIGISGRHEAVEMIKKLKNESLAYINKLNPKQRYRFDGAIVSAAFYNYLILNYGITFFRSAYGKKGFDDQQRTWDATPDGKEWVGWHRKRAYEE
jgi:hypothetical protein